MLSILTNAFGDGKKTTRDNYIFYCPVCQHRKPKLEVGIESHKWHCWVCNRGGHSIFSLFKWAKIGSTKLDELRRIVPARRVSVDIDTAQVELPLEYKPLWIDNHGDRLWRLAIQYLASRRVTPLDILKYRIGYCDSGEYRYMLIIPTYNDFGELVYYTTRTFIDGAGPKFKNPRAPRNIIGFESHINWNEPVILVESAFDAITVRRNAIPLFGKSISEALKVRVVNERVDTVYLCLDSDAIHDAINHIQFFLDSGILVYLVRIPIGHDPNSLGYTGIWDCINSAELVDSDRLFKLIVEDHLYGSGKTNLPYRRYSYSSPKSASRV